MKVCDKCYEETTQVVHIPLEDQWFDLCDKHMNELMKFLTTKDKRKRFFKPKAA